MVTALPATTSWTEWSTDRYVACDVINLIGTHLTAAASVLAVEGFGLNQFTVEFNQRDGVGLEGV